MSKTEDGDESERKLKMLEEILNRIQKLREEILKKKYEGEMKERIRKWGEFENPHIIADHLIISGTYNQEELFGETSDWAVIELTLFDPSVGSSASIRLGILDSEMLRLILEIKESIGKEWNKQQAEIVEGRKVAKKEKGE